MNEFKENGIIRIADDVVAVIASIATLDTDGVSSMSGGIAEGLAKRVGRKHVQKGVHVTVDDHEASIDLRVILTFGKKIDEVCHDIQRNVKEAVESMTGLLVKIINVRVDGVDFASADAVESSYS